MFTAILEGLTTGVFGFGAGVVIVEAAFVSRRAARRAAAHVVAAPIVVHAAEDRIAA